MVKKNILLTGIASLLMLGTAKAETVTSGNWSLNISVAATGDKVCTASTIAGAATTDYQLAITTSKVSPIQITVKALGQGDLAATIASDLPESKALMSAAGSQDGKLYWYIPNNSGELIKTIKAKWQLPFRSAGNPNEGVAFSLSGSSAILNYMEAECNDGLKLENDVLLNKLPAKKIKASTLTSTKVKSLKAKYLKTHQAIMALEQVEIDLVNLESEFQVDLSKKDQIVQTKKYLSQTLIPALVKEQSDIKAAMPKQRREAARLEAKVPGLQSALSAAKNRYQDLEAELRPILAEEQSLIRDINAYESAVASDERAVSSLKNDIANRRSTVDSMKRDIDGLNREIDGISRSLDSINRELEVLRGEKQDIEARHNQVLERKRNFRPQEKIRQRLANNSEFQSLKSKIQQANQKRKQLENQINNLNQKIKAAKNEFRECKRAKKEDCSAEKQKVDNLTSKRDAKKQELKSVDASIEPAKRQRKRIRQNVESDVNARYNKILDRERRVKRNLDIAKDNLQSARSKKQSIKSDIQDARNEKLNLKRRIESTRDSIQDLKFSLDSKQIDLQSSRQGLSRANQNLSSLRQRHNIPGKERNLKIAEDKHSEAYWNLKNTQDTAANLRGKVSSGQARLVSAKRQEADARQELADVKAAEVQVDKSLKEYNAKKKSLDANLVKKQKSVKANVVAYRKAL